jgi:hypothetical protein
MLPYAANGFGNGKSRCGGFGTRSFLAKAQKPFSHGAPSFRSDRQSSHLRALSARFLCTLGENAFTAPLWLHIHSTEALAGRRTMGRVVILVGKLALEILALLCGASGQALAASPPQQFDASNFQAAATKASEYCILCGPTTRSILFGIKSHCLEGSRPPLCSQTRSEWVQKISLLRI